MPNPGSSWIYFFQIYPCKIVLVLYQLSFKFCLFKQQFSCTVKKLDTSRVCLNVSVMNGYFSACDSTPAHMLEQWAPASMLVDRSVKKFHVVCWQLFHQRCASGHSCAAEFLSFVAVNPFWKSTLGLLMYWSFESCFVIGNRLGEWEQGREGLSQWST